MRVAGTLSIACAALLLCAEPSLAQTGGGQGGRGGNEGGGRSSDDGRYDTTGRGRGLVVELDGCLRSGATVVVTGSLGAPGNGVGVIAGGRVVPLTAVSWSDGWTQLRMPPAALPPGEEVELHVLSGGVPAGRLGRVSTCAGGGGTIGIASGGSGISGSGPAGAGVPPVTGGRSATAPDGRPEFVVSVAAAGAGAAAAALQAEGATVLRSRTLAALGETLLIVALPAGLPAGRAQATLDGAAPGAIIAPHNLYGFAAGPRVYAKAMVGAPDACRLAGPVRVGVIDGPVDTRHPALSGLPVRSRDFLAPGSRAAGTDHGTAVAALIAGAPGAGPLAGFAPGAEIYAASVFSDGREGAEASVETISAGLDWLAAERVGLANLSFAGPWNRVLERIIAAAAGRGLVLVAAAGNDGSDAAALPAGAPGVIAVTAVDAARRPYPRANRGGHIAFAAPGVDLWTAKAGGGAYASGTSFAAPIVTAFAARLLAREPGLGAEGVRARLQGRVLDLGPPGHDAQFGWGLALAPDC